jgi:RNA polymerase sigma-70 factor (ECF subfamily)
VTDPGAGGQEVGVAMGPDVGAQPVRKDLRALYQAEFARMCRLVRRLGVPDKDLEDAVQDVFLVAHRRWEDLDPERPAGAWLSGIAVRVASQWRRRSSVRHEAVVEVPETASPAPGADVVLDAQRVRARVWAGLEALPDEQRTVFVLHELEGFSAPEVAVAVGIPLNTAYSRLRLARSRFADAIRAAQPTEVRA